MTAKETESVVEAAIAEVVKRGTQEEAKRAAKRWTLLWGICFVILDLFITLTVVIILAHDTRDKDKDRASKACQNTAALAQIERTNVEAQEKQTADLVKRGNTFGIPKKDFDKLIKESKKQQSEFLDALDELTTADCKNLDFKPIVLPSTDTQPRG